MQTRFYLDARGASLFVGMMLLCALLLLVPMILSGTFNKLAVYFIPMLLILGTVWLAWARGTYVTVDGDNKQLYGTLGFLRARTTPLPDIVSINARKIFMGGMTEIYMKYRKKDGSLGERGLVNKESLRKSDFTKLLETIRSANPSIEIAKELLA